MLHSSFLPRRLARRLAAVSIAVITSLPAPVWSADLPPAVKTSVRADLLATMQKELARLEAQTLQEPGPDWPRPSAQVAYLLLAGFAAEGSRLEHLPESEQQFFEIAKQGGVQGRLFQVAPDARIALIDCWIQDKSGSYVVRKARLYVREGTEWAGKGSGTAIGQTTPP